MPDWKQIVESQIAPLRLNGSVEPDLIEELSQHLDLRYRELLSGGATEQDAQNEVMAELENLHPIRAEMPRHIDEIPAGAPAIGHLLEDFWKDIRYAFRAAAKNPLFVFFVVLTLSLGIGANTTVFTVVNALLLNPVPVPDSSSLVALGATQTKKTSKSNTLLPVSLIDLKDYQAKNEVFSSLAGYVSPRIVTLQSGGGSQRMFGELVTGNYFATLELAPAKGRFFLPEEDSASGAHPVAVLNYATWQTRFGGESTIIGKPLHLNNLVFTIVGIAPPGFIGMNAVFGPDVWIPAAMAEDLLPGEMHDALTARGKAVFQAVGRLKPGISRAEAQANTATIASALAHEYPESSQDRTSAVRPITEVLFGNSGTGGRAPILFGGILLCVVVGLVLLIACSNVANLLSARAATRQHEMAVRLAMGASRSRLIRQLLTESALLGLTGGIFGLAIGYAGLRLLWSFLPADVSANLASPQLDATVFLYTLLLSLITGFVFGTVPALRASRASVTETLKEESRTSGRSRNRITFSNALLVGQVAFSFVALVMAALFLRSIQQAYQTDPGFDTKHLAVFLMNSQQAGYAPPKTKAFYKEVRDRVARLPGVASVSWASNMPFWAGTVHGIEVEGVQSQSKSDTITAVLNTVDLHYFETAGVRIDSGRPFTEMDGKDSTQVAIVNQKMARDYWPNQIALGKRIRLPGETAMRQVVGVAKTANYSTIGEPPQPCVYVPLEQNFFDAMTLYVRAKGRPEQLLTTVQRELHSIAPSVAVDDVRTGGKVVDQVLFTARLGVGLLGVFGFLALGLASIGLYGVMAYSVNRRRREIGLRMALGAAQGSVLRLILKQGMSLVAVGVLIGFTAVQGIGRLLARMLYGVSAGDPVSVAAAATALLLVALIACYVPARWASRVDPLIALREG